MEPEIVIAIPSFNPDERLVELVRALRARTDAPVVLVDDGSTSARKSFFDECKTLGGVEVLVHEMNHGKGRALKTALDHVVAAHGDAVGCVTCDGDGEHSVDDIMHCMDEQRLHPEALVLGCRSIGAGAPFKSRFGNGWSRFVFRCATGRRFADTQTGLRGVPASAFKEFLELPGERFEFESEMLLSLGDRELVEFPIETIYMRDDEGSRKTTFHPLRDSWRINKVVGRHMWARIAAKFRRNKADEPAAESAVSSSGGAKLKDISHGGSAARRYFDVTYGPMPLWKACLMELCTFLFSGMPGALGIAVRSALYRPFFGECKGKVLIGRHVTFRHPGKIRFHGSAVLDDRCTVDAKGTENSGIDLGDGVYVGKNTIVYCKNGDIALDDKVSLSANCIVFSSNKLHMGKGTMVGSFSYLLSGGEYDFSISVPFCEQNGMVTHGPLEVGENVWLGAHVTVLDAASIGESTVVGAGSVVTKPLPAHVLALGVPATVRKEI